eukprot:gnl/TRDRNA2_/TRDRNA2_188131_c0_seq1.p1 gnl/TRDRNA2_/TRDRNA2_188131_c0~~gnl/TRDRNA2_/TRDRNA2_188131_c0_seq1.p1  ORF type:complete len:290 (+),score=86.38 gnl/TRDRNA2_/TRDRNA2_188131_c0_seq1:71-940(+)
MSSPLRRTRVLSSHLLPCSTASEATPGGFTFISETENVKAERRGRVVLLTLVRTKALNALCDPLMRDLGAAIQAAEADPNTGCIVLTGGGKAFAAGADIKEMAPLSFSDITIQDKFKAWECVSAAQIPIIAAVNGVAFGGGCEVAMMCDLIIASDKAVFGQPEIKLGIIPGAGGTQRLIRAVGKSKAMALILTGRNMSAAEAEKAGLVAEVVKHEELIPFAMKMADEIAGMGRLATTLAKEAVNGAYETSLKSGIRLEKKLFYSLFGTEDKKEGMDAFINKRQAKFTNK